MRHSSSMLKFLIIVVVALGAIVFTEVMQAGFANQAPSSNLSTRDQAIQKAQAIYSQLKNQGVDFSSGPCLSNNLMPDWVADIAHNPRQEVDDDPANQCASFAQGSAHHFVELDPQGQLIKTY